MSEELLDHWEHDFRAAARADDGAMFREHLEQLSSGEHLGRPMRPDEPQLMLEATIRVVRMCSAFASLDGRGEECGRFLNMQKYNSAEATDARYVLTFDICGKALARVLVESELQTIDLADLYGSPWADYEVVGFDGLWISHPDWSNLTKEEVRQLEEEVTNDLRFDLSEDEVDFWFDESLDETYLYVTVQDVYESDDESDD